MASFDEKPIHFFTDADAWNALLEAGPDPAGVRLKLRKKSSSAPGITWQQALDVALCHGWIDGQLKSVDADYVLQAFTPRRARSPWSQINREHVARLIEEGRMRAGGLAEIERAKADGRWDAAYRMKDLQIPEDLAAALAASPAAATTFAALPATERFGTVFRLSQLRRPETRARRITEYVAKLEAGGSPLAAASD